MKLYDRILPPKVMTLENGKVIKESRSRTPLILIVLLAVIIISGEITGFSLSTLLSRGEQFFVIIAQMFPPKWDYIQQIWTPLFDTIKMSLLGSVIGSVVVIPFSIIASSNIVKNRIIIMLTRLFLSIARTLPTLVTALIATYMFGLGTLAGTCAIAVFTFAYVGKQLYELIETADMGAYLDETVCPIICEGDVIGSVVLLNRDEKKKFGELEQKVAQSAAEFLGRQMSS